MTDEHVDRAATPADEARDAGRVVLVVTTHRFDPPWRARSLPADPERGWPAVPSRVDKSRCRICARPADAPCHGDGTTYSALGIE